MSLVSQRGGCSPSPQMIGASGKGVAPRTLSMCGEKPAGGSRRGDSTRLLMLLLLGEQEVLGREESGHPGVWEKWKPDSVF